MDAILAPRLRTQRRRRCAGLTYKTIKNVQERNRKMRKVGSVPNGTSISVKFRRANVLWRRFVVH